MDNKVMEEYTKLQAGIVSYVAEQYTQENILLKKDFIELVKKCDKFQEVQLYFIDEAYSLYVDYMNNPSKNNNGI